MMVRMGPKDDSPAPDLGRDPRILVSRTDRIGDLVLSLPVVKMLKKVYPHARVDLLVRRETAPVVDGQPGVDGIVIYQPDTDGSREPAARLAESRYDAVICLYPRPDLARGFARARIPIRIGTARRWYSYRFTHRVNISRRDSGRHEKDLNLDLLKPLGIDPDYSLVPEMICDSKAQMPRPNSFARVKADPKDESSVTARPLVVIHPGDGGSAANWPIKRYVEAAQILHDEDIHIAITGTQGEREKHLSAFSSVIGEEHIHSGRTDLPQLMQILAHSDLYIGGSTGPLHLAAALGTPVVGMYGPIFSTTPDRWGPCGDGHTVFVPDVPTCHCKVGACKLGNCMDRIAVDDVLAAARQALRGEKTAMPDDPRNKTRTTIDSTSGEGLCR